MEPHAVGAPRSVLLAQELLAGLWRCSIAGHLAIRRPRRSSRSKRVEARRDADRARRAGRSTSSRARRSGSRTERRWQDDADRTCSRARCGRTPASVRSTARRSEPRPCGGIGVAPQAAGDLPQLTAEENLRFFGRLYRLRGAELRVRVERGCKSPSSDRGGTATARFSGGLKRRSNLACCSCTSKVLLWTIRRSASTRSPATTSSRASSG